MMTQRLMDVPFGLLILEQMQGMIARFESEGRAAEARDWRWIANDFVAAGEFGGAYESDIAELTQLIDEALSTPDDRERQLHDALARVSHDPRLVAQVLNEYHPSHGTPYGRLQCLWEALECSCDGPDEEAMIVQKYHPDIWHHR